MSPKSKVPHQRGPNSPWNPPALVSTSLPVTGWEQPGGKCGLQHKSRGEFQSTTARALGQLSSQRAGEGRLSQLPMVKRQMGSTFPLPTPPSPGAGFK